MDYVRLGHTGLKVSRLCLGCMSYGSSKWRPWVQDEEGALPFFKAAIEAGINFFDTADVYSQGESERVTGKALKEYAKRHEVVIATKVHGQMGADANNRGLSRKHILDAIDRSLTRLGVDYVDLYQIHRFDPETPIEETLAVSRAHGWTPFVSMQPQYNLVYREEEREMLPLCREMGIGVIPWSPLARGFLAGGRAAPGEGNTERARTDEFSPRLYYREPDYAVVDAVSEVAKARGVPNMQVALAWVLKNPTITAPIVGASKAHHLSDAVGALEIKLTDDEVKALEKPYKPKPVLDHL